MPTHNIHMEKLPQIKAITCAKQSELVLNLPFRDISEVLSRTLSVCLHKKLLIFLIN